MRWRESPDNVGRTLSGRACTISGRRRGVDCFAHGLQARLINGGKESLVNAEKYACTLEMPAPAPFGFPLFGDAGEAGIADDIAVSAWSALKLMRQSLQLRFFKPMTR
jgi:hypothetical protein